MADFFFYLFLLCRSSGAESRVEFEFYSSSAQKKISSRWLDEKCWIKYLEKLSQRVSNFACDTEDRALGDVEGLNLFRAPRRECFVWMEMEFAQAPNLNSTWWWWFAIVEHVRVNNSLPLSRLLDSSTGRTTFLFTNKFHFRGFWVISYVDIHSGSGTRNESGLDDVKSEEENSIKLFCFVSLCALLWHLNINY